MVSNYLKAMKQALHAKVQSTLKPESADPNFVYFLWKPNLESGEVTSLWFNVPLNWLRRAEESFSTLNASVSDIIRDQRWLHLDGCQNCA